MAHKRLGDIAIESLLLQCPSLLYATPRADSSSRQQQDALVLALTIVSSAWKELPPVSASLLGSVDSVFGLVDSVFGLLDKVFGFVDSVFGLVDSVFGLVDFVFGSVDSVFGLVYSVFGLVDSVFGLGDSVLGFSSATLVAQRITAGFDRPDCCKADPSAEEHRVCSLAPASTLFTGHGQTGLDSKWNADLRQAADPVPFCKPQLEHQV